MNFSTDSNMDYFKIGHITNINPATKSWISKFQGLMNVRTGNCVPRCKLLSLPIYRRDQQRAELPCRQWSLGEGRVCVH